MVFSVFGWFPWFFKVVSWFFMVLVGVHGFSRWWNGFSWFLVGFHGFSRWFQGGFMVFGWFPWFFKVSSWIFIVINGPRLVKSELSAAGAK